MYYSAPKSTAMVPSTCCYLNTMLQTTTPPPTPPTPRSSKLFLSFRLSDQKFECISLTHATWPTKILLLDFVSLIKWKPCHKWVGLGLISGLSMQNWWWKKLHWDRMFSKSFGLPVNITPTTVRSHSFIYHCCYIISATDSTSKYNTYVLTSCFSHIKLKCLCACLCACLDVLSVHRPPQ